MRKTQNQINWKKRSTGITFSNEPEYVLEKFSLEIVKRFTLNKDLFYGKGGLFEKRLLEILV